MAKRSLSVEREVALLSALYRGSFESGNSLGKFMFVLKNFDQHDGDKQIAFLLEYYSHDEKRVYTFLDENEKRPRRNFDVQKWEQVKSHPEKRHQFISRVVRRLEKKHQIQAAEGVVTSYFKKMKPHCEKVGGRYRLRTSYLLDLWEQNIGHKLNRKFREVVIWFFNFSENREQFTAGLHPLEELQRSIVETDGVLLELSLFDSMPMSKAQVMAEKLKKEERWDAMILQQSKFQPITMVLQEVLEYPHEKPAVALAQNKKRLESMYGITLSDSIYRRMVFALTLTEWRAEMVQHYLPAHFKSRKDVMRVLGKMVKKLA